MFAGGRGWIWGGCSDNADFGENISKQFVDALENGHDSRAAVNRHNNEAGRLVSLNTVVYCLIRRYYAIPSMLAAYMQMENNVLSAMPARMSPMAFL